MIDIILPCYRASDTVEETIVSVKNQTYKSWNLIIIIDGPDKKLFKVISSACKAIRRKIIVILEKNYGVAYARNVAISHSKSKFIAFLDADDLWHPEKLSLQMKMFSKYPDLEICGTDYLRFKQKTNFIPKIETKIMFKKVTPTNFRYFNPFCFSSVILKRNLIGKKKFSNIGHEDYDFLIKVTRQNNEIKMGIIRTKLVHYRLSPNSQSGNIFETINKSMKIRNRYFGKMFSFFTFPIYVLKVFFKRYT